jgi:hypothetical protein
VSQPSPTSTQPAGSAHHLYLSQLDVFLRQSRHIQDAWDSYTDAHARGDGRPYDDRAYGRRQSQRDCDTLRAFATVYYHADELVHLADQQLAQLPSDLAQPYTQRLAELRSSTERLYAVRDAWFALHSQLPRDAVPGTEAYDGPLAESYAAAWHHLHQWAAHGQALSEINTLARKHTPYGTAAPAKTPPLPHTTTEPSPARR